MTRLGPTEKQRFVRLIHRNLDLGAFFEEADRALSGTIRYDSSCWLGLDPSTLLPTSHYTHQVDTDHLMALAANEFLEDDVNKFADLALAARPVGVLSQATQGDPRRSARFSSVLEPHGYGDGDELRAVLLDGESVWGCVAIHRRVGTFSEDEANDVAAVSHYLGEGVRRAVLLTGLSTGDGPDAPGLIVLRDDDSVESMTPGARHWLAQIVDVTGDRSPIPLVVVSIARKARDAVAGTSDDVASATVPSRTEGWLLMHASLLEGRTDGSVAVMLHPARQPEIASTIVEAHGLSRREREVTRLVLAGRSTQEIADELHLSTYTVQDHLKAVFDKVGVRSRRELVARIFMQHYAPALQAAATHGADGSSLTRGLPRRT